MKRPRRRGLLARLRIHGLPSLGARILLVNLLALIGFYSGVLYLDRLREQLLSVRSAELLAQGEMLARLLQSPEVAPGAAEAYLAGLSFPSGTRLRLYGPGGALLIDNWRAPTTVRFSLEDPTTAGFPRWSARALDQLVDLLSGATELPFWSEPATDVLQSQEIARSVAATRRAKVTVGRSAERAIVLEAAVPVVAGPAAGSVLLLTSNTVDIVETVRDVRGDTFRLFLALLAASVLVSIYLARTISRPLGELSLAAQRVRRGRARDISIPRFPGRRDEIGRLARALSDMTGYLRNRVDATESFAADVAHELKNPLASLRSAVEALGTVRDPAARAQLFDLIRQDVGRIDRLIGDISAASRIEAELSRAAPELVDVGQLVDTTARALAQTASWRGRVRLEVDGLPPGAALVLAGRGRLEQVVVNLVDNAVSFSPPGGVVRIFVRLAGEAVELGVEDEGPGVPEADREAVFERFWSARPDGEAYGRHSGLGLSIVRAIVEAFDGRVTAEARPDGKPGALFRVRLPALVDGQPTAGFDALDEAA